MRLFQKILMSSAILGTLLVLFAAGPSKADFARRLSYQGRLTNSDGVPLASGNYAMEFRLFTVDTGGTAVWTESHAAVSVDNGLFSAILGGTSSLNGIDFNSTAYYIEVVVAGTTYSPRQRLTAAPFALNVPDGLITSTKMADGAALVEISDDDGTGSGLDCDLLDGYDWSSFPAFADVWVDVAGDTMSGTLNMGNNAISNIDWANSDDGSGSLLDADLIDGVDSTLLFILNQNETVTGTPSFNGGTTGSSPPFNVDSTFVVTSLNADLLDGYTTGNASGNIPLSNGTVNTNLNADLLDGYHAADLEAVLDHGQLQGLADDDHTQYFHLSQSETVSGIPAFNGGTTGSSAPFTVDSTYKVTNLNADLLDGYDWTTVPNGTDIWVNETGDTMTGNLNMSNSDIIVTDADAAEATISLYGSSQGTGRVYVGQSTAYGGGMIYNGDGTPASNTTTDHISIYRRDNGVDVEVLHWAYGSNTAYFTGELNMGGNRVENMGAPNSTDDAVHAGRTITAGTGLTGGGNLTADRTISLDKSHTNCSFTAVTNLTGVSQDTTCAAGFCAMAAVNDTDGTTRASAKYDSASLYFNAGVEQFTALKVLCCPCQ